MTIDWWTLGIQTVNVVILVWLLGRFFWRPVAAMIEQRRADGADEFWPRRRRSAARRPPRSPRSSGRAPALRRNAKRSWPRPAKPPSRRGPRVWTEAAKEAASLEAAAKAAIEKEKAAVDKAWAERASRLAVDNRGAPGRPSGRPGGARRLPGLAPQGDPDSAGPGAAGRGGERRHARSDQRDCRSSRPTRSATGS